MRVIVMIDCHIEHLRQNMPILFSRTARASEQMDFALDASCGNMSYVIFTDQASNLRFECKTIY